MQGPEAAAAIVWRWPTLALGVAAGLRYDLSTVWQVGGVGAAFQGGGGRVGAVVELPAGSRFALRMEGALGVDVVHVVPQTDAASGLAPTPSFWVASPAITATIAGRARLGRRFIVEVALSGDALLVNRSHVAVTGTDGAQMVVLAPRRIRPVGSAGLIFCFGR